MMNETTSAAIDLAAFAGSPAAQALAFLQAQPQPAFLVGGVVRDLLLGRPTRDLDVTVASGAIALARRLADALKGAFFPLDKARDTGRVVLASPDGAPFYIDCAAWRGDSLEQDLRLRDFTINTLAAAIETQERLAVIDVCRGLDDLAGRRLRLTSGHALRDDPLRGLRAVRLAAELAPWAFRLEKDTVRQLQAHASLLTGPAAERIRDELHRILAAPQPAAWLKLAANLGQLAVVLPEVIALRGVTQSPPHRWDVFEHTIRVLDSLDALEAWLAGQAELPGPAGQLVAETLAPYRTALQAHLLQGESAQRTRGEMLRWAALAHDWGKPATWQQEEATGKPSRIRFHGHERISANLAVKALRRLRFNEAETQRVAGVVLQHMRPSNLAGKAGQLPSRRAVFRFFRDCGDAGLEVALLSIADIWDADNAEADLVRWRQFLGVTGQLIDDFFNRREVTAPKPLIGGRDLMAALNLTSGPLIGRLLAEVLEAQAAGDVSSVEQALAYAARLADQWDRSQQALITENPSWKQTSVLCWA